MLSRGAPSDARPQPAYDIRRRGSAFPYKDGLSSSPVALVLRMFLTRFASPSNRITNNPCLLSIIYGVRDAALPRYAVSYGASAPRVARTTDDDEIACCLLTPLTGAPQSATLQPLPRSGNEKTGRKTRSVIRSKELERPITVAKLALVPVEEIFELAHVRRVPLCDLRSCRVLYLGEMERLAEYGV